jgi:hypothetical protein
MEAKIQAMYHAQSGINAASRNGRTPTEKLKVLVELLGAHAESIIRLSHPSLGNSATPMIIVMTTGTSANDGRELLRQVQKGGTHDMAGSWLLIDVVHMKCSDGIWKCLGLHVYCMRQRRLLTIATCYLQSEKSEVFTEFWKV